MKNIDTELLRANLEKHPDVVKRAYKRLVGNMVARRYSIRDELAILRQRDEKPEEYAEYYAYVEECKRELKAAIGLEDKE